MSQAGEPFEILWAGPARRALQRLPEKVAGVMVEFVYGPLAGNPNRVGRPLRFELEGRRSAHRGDYRVVYRVDEQARRVYVEAVQHRADLYRRR